MKRILVPTDFSHVAQNAFNYAIEVASKLECELLLYHAYENNNKSGSKWGSFNNGQDQIEHLEEQMNSLKEKYEKILSNKGLSLQTKVVERPVSSLFENIVGEYAADLIIMGSKGASGWEKMIFGSVATQALDEAKVPVIVVPPNKPHLSLEKSLLALDLNHLDVNALTPFKELASITGTSVTVLNINNGKTNEEGLQQVKDFLEEIETTYTQEPLSKSINQSINDIIDSNNYNLLCMIRRKKGFWDSLFEKSVTNIQLNSSQVPLMVLPEN